MMTKVIDVMDVPYTCRSDETVGDVIKHLMDAEVGSLIVVDERGRLVGHITDGDIARFVTKKNVKVVGWGEMLSVILDDDDENPTLEAKLRELLSVKVIDVANKGKLYVDKYQNLEDAAEYLSSNGIKKIAVVEKGKVVGVVTRSAIMRHLLGKILPD
jgi:predicted transcriptional regulator